MARTQWTYLEKKKSESGQTGTATYDLPERDYLNEICVVLGATPTAATNPALPTSDAITKVEIIDGGTVIKSLTANQIKALSMIRGHNPLGSSETNDNAVEGFDQLWIPMGGEFNGQKYAPNMGAFTNPQLKLTWDFSLTTTEFGMTCDADATPALKISLLAQIIRDASKITHGYLKSTILKEFTQATSTQTVIEVPRGENLVGLGVEAGYDAKEFTDDVNEVELNFDNGAWIPFHFYAEEIPLIQQQWFKRPFQYNWFADMIDAKDLDTHMGYLLYLHAVPQSILGKQTYVSGEFAHKGVETLDITDLATPTACTEYRQYSLTSIGYIPFHLWYCPVSKILGDEVDTLDTKAFSRIELKTISGASASTSSTPDIIAEYLMT